MRRIAIVGNESHLLEGVHELVDDLNIVSAKTNKEVTALFKGSAPDLTVLDVDCPDLTGLRVLLRLYSSSSTVPILAIYDGATSPMEEMFKEIHVAALPKPLDPQSFLTVLGDAGTASTTANQRSLSAADFLRLVVSSGKTCIVSIRSDDKEGVVYLKEGQLWSAFCSELLGEYALKEMLDWTNPRMDIGLGTKEYRRTINCTLDYLVTNALDKLVDDAFDLAFEEPLRKTRENGSATQPVDDKSTLDTAATKSLAATTNTGEDIPQIEEEKVMALENHLEVLKDVKGYKASAIMDFTGEILAADSSDENIDLNMVGATFNDIFRSAHEASIKIGLDACSEAVINTPKGLVVMRCSGVDAPVHFHIIGIMEAGGNQALLKMQMEKIIAPAMADLS